MNMNISYLMKNEEFSYSIYVFSEETGVLLVSIGNQVDIMKQVLRKLETRI